MNDYILNSSRKQRGMTPQCEAIYNALKIVPCLHFNQLKYFMPPYISTFANYEKSIANYLSYNSLVHMKNDCIYDISLSCIDESLIDSVWVAIDTFKESNDVYTALRTAIRPQYPCVLSVFKDGETRIKIMPITSKTDFAKIIFENNNYKKIKDDIETMYIIVLRNVDLAQEFAKTKPNFPFQIALLDGPFGEYPTIKYYNIET